MHLKETAEICAEKVKIAVKEISFFEEPFKHVVVDIFFLKIPLKVCWKSSLTLAVQSEKE